MKERQLVGELDRMRDALFAKETEVTNLTSLYVSFLSLMVSYLLTFDTANSATPYYPPYLALHVRKPPWHIRLYITSPHWIHPAAWCTKPCRFF